MIGPDRRAVLAFLALAPTAAAWPALSHAQASAGALPQGDHALRRVLVRDLGKGAQIVVTRAWLCRFDRDAGGSRVEGRQTACEVEAPAPLAPLAAMERERVVAGLFPARLDERGLIRSAGDGASPDLSVQFARALALFGPSASADERSFIAALSQTAAALVSEVPADLFFPAAGTRRIERAVPVEGASDGAIAVALAADCDPASGLLRTLEKRVETRGGGMVRTALERWTLAPA